MNQKRINAIAVIFCFLLNISPIFAQTNRGAANIKVKKSDGKTEEIKLYAASYALVIGNGSYTNGWDNLPGVKTDVAAVKNVLEQQGFVVETAENLSSRDFSNRIQKFIDDHGYEADNRLLIYYAGHGHTLKSTGDGRDLGYVVPIDTPLPATDEIGFKRRAIPMDDIQNYAKKIQSRHALFIFDSCFSGRLVTRNAIVVPPIIQESVAYPVRQFITAGAANQPVPDESIFRRAFVRALEGEADRNADGYVTGTELAEYLKEKVTNYSNRQQTPQYGKINDIELDRGDFVFEIPGDKNLTNNVAVSTNQNADSEEIIFWNSIKNSGNVGDFNEYIKRFPNGKFVSEAKIKLTGLETVSSKEVSNSSNEIKDSVSYGLLIDNSNSLKNLLPEFVNFSRLIINGNKAEDETFVVRFVSSDKIQVLQNFSSDKTALNDGLNKMVAEGGYTALYDALYLASENLENAKNTKESKRRILILVSDGEEVESYYTYGQMFKKIGESGVKIYAVGFTQELDKSTRKRVTNFLEKLTSETGGKVFFPKSNIELPQIANEINTLMRTGK